MRFQRTVCGLTTRFVCYDTVGCCCVGESLHRLRRSMSRFCCTFHSAVLETIRRRPFMARMVAQRNSRGFQSTLSEREHVLDKHILHLLEKFSDPTFFKKKHGYNVHGQMLGKDGKMIVKVSFQGSMQCG